MTNSEALPLINKSDFADLLIYEHPAMGPMREWFSQNGGDEKFLSFLFRMSESGILITPKYLGSLIFSFRLSKKLQAMRFAYQRGDLRMFDVARSTEV